MTLESIIIQYASYLSSWDLTPPDTQKPQNLRVGEVGTPPKSTLSVERSEAAILNVKRLSFRSDFCQGRYHFKEVKRKSCGRVREKHFR